MNRPQKVIDIPKAAEMIHDGDCLGSSGFSYMNPPMALVREIIRKGIKDLTLISGPTSGIETDLLIGAGCVRKVIAACVAFENIAPIGPNFREFAEKGKIEVWECDEAIWHIGLKAGAYGIPYMLWGGGVGTSIPRLNPDIEEIEVNSRKWLKVPALQPDVTIIHAGLADNYGNIQYPEQAYLGRRFCEEALARATKRDVIAQVEEIIPNEEVVAHKERTILNNCWVVKAQRGAHPGGASGYYMPDLEHYRDYVKSAEKARKSGDRKHFNEYLQKYVFGFKDHESYLEKIGKSKLLSLEYKF